MNLPHRFCSEILFSLLLVLLVPSSAWAQNITARIVKINGSGATVTPKGGVSAPAMVNAQLVEGALIETPPKVEVFLETFEGAVATIRGGSKVEVRVLRMGQGADAGKRVAELNLEKGNIISTLDPSKRPVTEFGIRTPRGVAAARGTVYGVTVIPSAGDRKSVV